MSIAGDGQAAPLPDPVSARALFADADPVSQLSGCARTCREINSRSAPVYRILLSAAADIIHALVSPRVYRLLVGDRSLAPKRYEQWLKGVLISQLLPPPATGQTGGTQE